jgi:preprotein translocase subunit SecG
MIEQAILIVHVLAALVIIGLILLQQGKGADAGASFGGGSSQTVFGVQGTGNILTRWTSLLAAIFFATSLSLAYFAKQKSEVSDDLIIDIPVAEQVSVEQNDEIPALEEASAESVADDVPVEAAEE